MGMTIEEALNLLNNSIPKSNNAFSIQMNEAISVIGVIMCKYQKIEQILKDDTYYEDYGSNAERFIVSAISEVVENGNDD